MGRGTLHSSCPLHWPCAGTHCAEQSPHSHRPPAPASPSSDLSLASMLETLNCRAMSATNLTAPISPHHSQLSTTLHKDSREHTLHWGKKALQVALTWRLVLPLSSHNHYGRCSVRTERDLLSSLPASPPPSAPSPVHAHSGPPLSPWPRPPAGRRPVSNSSGSILITMNRQLPQQWAGTQPA